MILDFLHLGVSIGKQFRLKEVPDGKSPPTRADFQPEVSQVSSSWLVEGSGQHQAWHSTGRWQGCRLQGGAEKKKFFGSFCFSGLYSLYQSAQSHVMNWFKPGRLRSLVGPSSTTSSGVGPHRGEKNSRTKLRCSRLLHVRDRRRQGLRTRDDPEDRGAAGQDLVLVIGDDSQPPVGRLQPWRRLPCCRCCCRRRCCRFLVDVDGHQVADLASVSFVVDRHNPIIEDLIRPRHLV